MFNRFFLATILLFMMITTAVALQVTVTWTDPNAAPNNETGTIIQRSVDGAAYVTVTTVAPDITTFNESLDALGGLGHQYCYKLAPQNAFGTAAFSTPVCGTPSTPNSITNVNTSFMP